jgi:predicted DNA-binding transcriptional regulator AlpA
MTETKLSDLIGLSELAELLGVTKGEANAMRQRHGFPAPVVKLRMGPAWDKREVLEWHGEERPATVSDPQGILTLRIPIDCHCCDSKSLTPVEGSLQVVITAGPSLEYQTHPCPVCRSGPANHYVYIEPKEA